MTSYPILCIDGPIKVYNAILRDWSIMETYSGALGPHKIYPKWIRLSDGEQFTTPDNNGNTPKE